MKQKSLLILCAIGMLVFMSGQSLWAQGVTTSKMNGKVVDASGAALPGATVIAVHVPTGARYGNVTDASGFYRIPNMKAGGPYNVTISFVGFENYVREGIHLTLGQSFKLDGRLSESATELSEVVVTAGQGEVFDGNRTGSETTVSERQLTTLPNASRTINDFTRLTPQASFTGNGGISIAGTNNRFNSIFIDGAVSNDVFGLAGNGQNGGQIAGLSLISIDALEQIQVAVSPYDVTLGGFSGGSISAVTRSGSNEFEGSVYYLVRNQSLAGKTPGFLEVDGVDREKLPEFTAKTYGLRIGGPIIKDKLFFFVNGEIQRDETPSPFDFNTYTGGATLAEVNQLVTALQNFGYQPGSFEDVVSKLEAEKFLIKFDYNISENHKLTFRHSYNNGENFSPRNSSTSRIRFANSGVFFPSKTNSSAFELNSNFGDKSNKLVIGRTIVRDDRDPLGQDFPYIDIRSGDIEVGSEEFSTANVLEQDIYTLTNNFSLYKGKHTWTFGTHNELYDIRNVFVRQNFGSYDFNDIAGFLAGTPTTFAHSYSLVDNVAGDNTGAAAEFKAMQLGFYVQDEIQVNDKLKITAGLRLDMPFFLDDPATSAAVDWATTKSSIESFGYDLKGAEAGKAPGTQFLFAPRFGFNLDVKGDQSTQVRGGIGIFTSRVPFVWPGAMYNNNGQTVGGTFQTSNLTFNPDPYNQPTLGDFGGVDAVPQGQLDLFASDFKYPQVFRGSIAVDHKLPWWGLIGTAEFIYTKTINNVFYENVNLKPSTSNFGGTPDTRPIFDRRDEIDPRYSRIILGSNTSKGFTSNISLQLQKPFDNGLTASLAYNFGRAESIFEGTSSQNSSQWRGVYSLTGRNNAGVGRSDFDAGSRWVGTLSYRKEYAGFMASTITLFYNRQVGTPFSYTYDDDIANEDSRERSLIYVPANANEIVFDESNRSAAEQWADLDAYIANDDHLKNRRGQYAERNGARLPSTSILDLKFAQEFFYESASGRRHTLQVTLDIFNFGNLINKDWGQRWNTPNGGGTSVELLEYEGNITDPNTGVVTPTFSFRDDINSKKDIITKDDTGIISSRWQMQLGVRYTF